MTDKTAFEDYWINNYGPNWECFITLTQKLGCEHSWNAALDAAISECDQVKEDHWRTSARTLDSSMECKTQIQKLRRE